MNNTPQYRIGALIIVLTAAISFAVYGVREYRQTAGAQEKTIAGIEAFKNGNFRSAAESFAEAARLQPGFAPAHLNLGLSLKQLGRYEEAVAELERALELSHEEEIISTARFELSRIYGDQAIKPPVRKKDWNEKAVWHLERLVQMDPDNPEYRLRLGYAAFSVTDPGQGLSEMQYASDLADSPEHAWIHRDLLKFYLSANLLDKARAEEKRLEELKPAALESLPAVPDTRPAPAATSTTPGGGEHGGKNGQVDTGLRNQ